MSQKTSSTMQLKIQLRNVTKPPVWRRVLIPSDMTFLELHYVIQGAFGWYNEHLFKFQHRPYDREWTVAVPEEGSDYSATPSDTSLMAFGMMGIFRLGPEQKDASSTKVGAFLKSKRLEKFVYIYDFGDDWIHDITIEQVSTGQALLFPRCIDGKGACPPEDCGGPWGYQEMKESGEADDPKYFDLEEADADVRHYRSMMESGEVMWGRKYQGIADPDETDDYDDEDDWDETDDDEAEAEEEVAYTYQHPEYPTTLELENPWVGEELCKPENALGLKPQLVKRILALPADSLRRDLERLIMYHVGLTCDGISDDYDPGDHFNGVIGASLILLSDVGNGESSLDVVLDVMRQSPDFSEYHICDMGEDLFIPTICKLGQAHLDKLLAYAKEPGLYRYLQCQAFAAVRVMAFYNPDLRESVVEWFRSLLRYYADYSQSHDVDCVLMGFLVSEVADLHAPELLPEVKALFDAGVVHEGTSGDYKSVARDIKKRGFENPLSLYSFNADSRFKEMREMYKD